MRCLRPALMTALAVLVAGEAPAWPANLVQCLARDARRLVPRSLARLIAEREVQVLDEAARFPTPLGQALAADLQAGRLQPETLAALDAQAVEAISLLKQQRVTEGIVRLGALLRVPADLSDPVLTAGPTGYPAGVTREYYAFVEGNLNKIPVVLDDPPALKLPRRDLPDYWQRLLERSQGYSGVILTEMYQGGRVVSHTRIDYRSPVFGVASLSYSRAVTAIAATWLAVWREARGDVTRMRPPRELLPRDAPPVRAPQDPVPSPEARP